MGLKEVNWRWTLLKLDFQWRLQGQEIVEDQV